MRRFKVSSGFWNDFFSFEESVTPYVLPRVLLFGLWSLVIWIFQRSAYLPSLGIEAAPYEFAGGALGVVLVLRTNAGYDRWWEAHKLWGGIVNQSRNVVIVCVANGPADDAWRGRVARLCAAFAHATRQHLRDDRDMPEVAKLLGPLEATRYALSSNPPAAVSLDLARLLQEGRELGMDPRAFLQAEQQRGQLIDHLGGCERILKSPLPRAYSIQIRRFIILFLLTLPFVLVLKVGWLTPVVMVMVTYPLVALDKIGVQLQNPFSLKSLNHLPLDDICQGLETNLLSLAGFDIGVDLGKSFHDPSVTRAI